MLAANPRVFFTIPRFDGYPAVLIRLKLVTKRALRYAIVDGWLACAPPDLANAHIEQERRAARRPDSTQGRRGEPASSGGVTLGTATRRRASVASGRL